MNLPKLWYPKSYIKHVEPIKLIFKYKNIRYNDIKVDDNIKYKKDLNKHYFNQILRYEDENINLVHIPLIINYLGFKYNIHGKTYQDEYKIKTIVNNCTDFKKIFDISSENIYKYHINRESAILDKKEVNGLHLYYINELIQGPYVCGNDLTIADICILSLIKDCLIIDINSLEHYYNINRMCLELYNNQDTKKLIIDINS